MRNKRIEYIIDEILDQYAYADESTRPWIIGFSGGKDSTVLLMLVWIALEKLKELPGPFQLRRPIYVVCNDGKEDDSCAGRNVEIVGYH